MICNKNKPSQLRLCLFPIVICLAGLISSFSFSFAACQQTLNVAYDPKWPPYQFEHQGKPAGIDILIIKHLSKRTDCRVIFKKVDHDKALNDLKLGWVDVALPVLKTRALESYARLSDLLYSKTYSLFVRQKNKDRFNYPSIMDLRHTTFKLGVLIGQDYGQTYQDYIKQGGSLNIRRFNRITELPRKLVSDQIHGFLMDNQQGYYLLRKLGLLSQVTATKTIIDEEAPEFHIAFNKKAVSGATIEQFDAALLEMHIDGTLHKIITLYQPKQRAY